MEECNKHVGSSLDDFLKAEGALEETRAIVLKETLARQVEHAKAHERNSGARGTGETS